MYRYAWVSEKGAYAFFLGDNVRDTKALSFVYEKEDTTLSKCAAHCRPQQMNWRMKADGSREEVSNAEALPFPIMDKDQFFHGAPPENIWNAQIDTKRKNRHISEG